MKFVCLSTVALLCFASTVHFYGRAQAVNREPRSPLRLTTNIINQKYCAGDEDLEALQLELQLSYTNTGQQPLILYKGSNNISQMMISRSEEAAASEWFEAQGSVTNVTTESHIELKDSVPSELFVVLPPTASYKTESRATVFVSRGDVGEVAGVVTAGNHVLQIEVPTWAESDDLAKELRRRWRQSGFLQYNPVTSLPMPFKVKKNRLIENCY